MHSLDSLKLAQRLDRFAAELGRKLPLLLECNVSGEETKYGWPAWDEDRWEALLPEVAQVIELKNLEVRGLMTMAPFFDEPELARPYFRRLRRLQEFFKRCLPRANWQELSMGMSGDYIVAIQEGATIVRIGTAIMGPRPAA
jgi:pyridoxal phosphate enzyme (YggS family)